MFTVRYSTKICINKRNEVAGDQPVEGLIRFIHEVARYLLYRGRL